MKQRTCKVCKKLFEPTKMGQKVCDFGCAIELALSERGKAEKVAKVKEKQADKVKLDSMRTKPQLTKLAQTAFNSFVRARDAGKACISCGVPLPATAVGGAFDCGHYRSVGSAPHMRFVEDNAHGQCKHCNMHLAGNHVAYRTGLIQRVGQRAVDLIESDCTLRKYSKEGLEEIARHYNAEARRLKKAAE
jgi:hypothetical protein